MSSGTARAVPAWHTLDPLFFPERIALYGISDRADAWGSMAYAHLREHGYAGEVVAVRARSAPAGVTVVDDLRTAGPVDALLVSVPGPAAIDAVAEGAAAGVGSIIVYSAGFAEDGDADGQERQRRLVSAAGEVPLLGPNCLGVVSGPGRATMAVSAFLTRPHLGGPVGLVTQSGAMGFLLAEHLARRGIGFDFYASTGNEAGLGAAELLAYLAQRPEVRVLGCYLETVRDVAAWRLACRTARESGRHVVVLRVGTSVAGRRAALSHTAAATGENDLFAAIAREDGVHVVDDELAFADTVRALHRDAELPHRPRLGIITMSGGAAAMVSDQVTGIADVPEFTAETRNALRATGVALAGTANPVDLTGMFFRYLDRIETLVDIVAADPSIDAVVLLFTFGDKLADRYAQVVTGLRERGTRAWFVWAGALPGVVEALGPTGVVVESIPALMHALAAHRIPYSPAHRRALGDVGPRPERYVLPSGVVAESALAAPLAAAGLEYVPMAVADGPTELVSRARELPGPLVVKVEHPDAPHRARLGLLELGVDHADLEAVAAQLLDRARSHGLAGARLVAQPVLSSVGCFSLGALRDPAYGPVLSAGAGGDRVETSGAHARAVACLPLTPSGLRALHAVADAQCGGRVDLHRFAAAAGAVAWLLEAHPQVHEVDVNPVLVRADGSLVAVDALAVG